MGDKYYQIEFLTDVKGDIGMEPSTIPGISVENWITNINIKHARPYWTQAGGERIPSKDTAIARAKTAVQRDENHEAWGVNNIEHLPTGRIVTYRPSYTAWRVVEVSRVERKVVWLDTRPHVRQMLRDMKT